MSQDTRSRGEAGTSDDRAGGLYPSPTARQEIEIILARQLAGYLAVPIVIVDASHVVVYYNEKAERVLGRQFDAGGPIPPEEWTRAFEFTDEAGDPIPTKEMPPAVAIRSRGLAHRTFWMRGLDGVKRHMEGTAVPLIGNAGRFLGALAFFDEIGQ